MKFLIKKTATIFPAIMLVMASAIAQQKQAGLQNALSSSYKTVTPVKNKQDNAELEKATAKINPVLNQAVEDMSVATKNELTKAAAESEMNNKEILKSFPVKKTSIDLIADLLLAPSPVYNPPVAGKIDADALYKPYYGKLEQRQNQLAEIAKKNNRYQEIYNKEGNAGLEKRAAAEADKNALVREMGGTEKLKNMSDAERKQAAEQMKARLQQNPGLLTGNTGDPGMKTMQQKLVSDPAYAKRFNSMTEEEKQAEMKKYMTIKPQEGTANRTYTKSQEQQDAEKAVEISQLIERTAKRMEAATATYSRMTTSTNKLIDEMKDQLGKWMSATTQTIPMVELGEYGHDRDPELMRALEITGKHTAYAIAKKEMELRTICWNQYKAAIAASLQEFNNYADNYKWSKQTDGQLFNGTYNDPKIAGAFSGYYGVILDIAKSSETITNNAKSAQKIFEGLL